MADGAITTITELGRVTIPGSGHTRQGVASNNKIMVWGRIVGTYVSTGLDLAARGGRLALGVHTLDHIALETRYCGSTATTVPTDMKLFIANLSEADKIFVHDQMGTDSPAEPTDGEAVTIDYVIIGDDARAPDLV